MDKNSTIKSIVLDIASLARSAVSDLPETERPEVLSAIAVEFLVSRLGCVEDEYREEFIEWVLYNAEKRMRSFNAYLDGCEQTQ